ncbi:UvrD-helicase domain-containing protein [Flavobacterium sp.]
MIKKPFSIYDASAGSGKTYTLVKEYLKIILVAKKADAYRNILAITFTNKAVHEMKSRVVESLSEFAKKNPSKKSQDLMVNIQLETGLTINAIHLKAKSIIKNLIHNYAAFDISTIDKFTHKVIRSFAHDLNLPITFEVSLDTENLLTEAVDAIIAEAGNDKQLTELLVNYTLEKTNDDKSWDISREIMETGKLILNENNREEITHFHNKSIDDFEEIKSNLTTLCKNIKDETASLSIQAFELISQNTIDEKSFSGGHFPNHLKKLAEKEFNPKNKTYHQFEDIKINKTAKDSVRIEQIIPNLLQILDLVYKKYEKLFFYEAFLKNITPLSLLNTLNSKLKTIQEEQNILSIAEFNQLIFDQIQNQPAPFIYERLGEKYRHFFIDEFQDTSQMQWQNLIPLISNSLSGQDDEGTQGSLMIVGDPKQSIYRWRGGKAEQFIALSKDENPFPNVEKTTETLGTNYRSYSEVIEFNNEFFGFLSNQFENDDYRDLYQNHSHQEINSKTGGFVSISFIPKVIKRELDEEEENITKHELYLEKIFEIIQKAKANGFSNKDIAILTRKKDNGILVANYLTQKEIPILSSESLLLGSSSEVKVIVNLLRYLNNYSDLESKANFLCYLGQKEPKPFQVHDFMAKGMEFTTEADFEKWLQEFDVSFSFHNIRKKSLYEATEIIISRVIPMGKRTAYVQFFQDIVLEQDIKRQAGTADFLVYWDNNSHKLSIPSPENNDAVKIMTIHKSKGLEFPVVIFPFADEDYSKGPKEKIWLTADDQMGLPKVLVDKSSNVENYGEDASKVYSEKKQEELLDDINVLYVALTRAEEQLYVISEMQTKAKTTGEYPNNMATFFINYLINRNEFEEARMEYSFGDNIKISAQKEVTEPPKIIPQISETLDSKNIKIAQRESLMWNTLQQKAIEFGNILHEILSFISSESDINLALTKAIENGLITEAQKDDVSQTVLKIITHHELKEFFAEEHKILNEKTIIQKTGGIIKPDRMAISTNNEVFLLDYKTGQHLPKHRTQLEQYQNAIESMGYKVAKKTLVYIGEGIEIVNL